MNERRLKGGRGWIKNGQMHTDKKRERERGKEKKGCKRKDRERKIGWSFKYVLKYVS